MRLVPWLLVVCLLLPAPSFARGGQSPPASYTLTDLGEGVFPTALQGGQVVGSLRQGTTVVPAQLTPARRIYRSVFGRATGLFGQLVVGALQGHAFAFTPRGGVIDLDAGDPEAVSTATGVNSSAQIPGFVLTSTGPRPVVYLFGHRLGLGTLGNQAGSTGFALAINEAGDIVGQSDTAAGIPHATLWRVDGTLVDLDPEHPAAMSVASALTDDGFVVGEVDDQAFTWTEATGLVRLPLPSGFRAARATSVSQHHVVVGDLTPDVLCCLDPVAVRFDAGGPVDLVDLVDAPGWTFEFVVIDPDTGVLAGLGRRGEVLHGFVLTPQHEGRHAHQR